MPTLAQQAAARANRAEATDLKSQSHQDSQRLVHPHILRTALRDAGELGGLAVNNLSGSYS